MSSGSFGPTTAGSVGAMTMTSMAARILFLLAATRARPQTTLLVMHTPKTGGTEFRNLLFARARERNLTLQAHYGPDIVPNRDKGVRQFDKKKRPADIARAGVHGAASARVEEALRLVFACLGARRGMAFVS